LKTLLVLGAGAVAAYVVWKYALGGAVSETPCGCHGSGLPLASASMTVDSVKSTQFGPPMITGVLVAPMPVALPTLRPEPFSATLRSVLAGEDAPQPALPTPNTDTFASASGQPGTNGTLPGQVNPPAPLAARLRNVS
jgi:hypothetical protein